MSDQELLERLRADPAGGMEPLLRQYGPLLRYVIGGILPDTQDAEDCFSEVSLSLWQKLSGYDPARGSLSAYLTAAARNTALNLLKARQRRQSHLTEPLTEPAHHNTPEAEVLRRERAQRLQAALERLSLRDKQLFYRKYYYLQSISQIAAEMGLTERAAEGRLYRLRQQLRREVGGDNDA